MTTVLAGQAQDSKPIATAPTTAPTTTRYDLSGHKPISVQVTSAIRTRTAFIPTNPEPEIRTRRKKRLSRRTAGAATAGTLSFLVGSGFACAWFGPSPQALVGPLSVVAIPIGMALAAKAKRH